MRYVAALRSAGLLLGFVAGCSGDRLAPVQADLEVITVSPGLQPDITWSPGGAVYSITVREGSAGPILWTSLGQLHQNRILPAVGYGSTPPGAIATANPILPLAAGKQYTVELGRVDGRGVVTVVATRAFGT